LHFIILFMLLAMSSSAYPDELEQAYQKEYAYLVAEKKALEQRLRTLKRSQADQLAKIEQEIAEQQQIYLQQQNQTDRLNRQIVEANRGVDVAENDNLLLDTTLIQARESLDKLGFELDEIDAPESRLQQAFKTAESVMQRDGEIQREAGEFFLMQGEKARGDIIAVGRIARFGVSDQGSGLLAPAGNGMFKLWDNNDGQLVSQIASGQSPDMIDIFLYDSVDKAIDRQQEKNLEDDIKAGGLVGQVIIGLGAIGVLLVVVRSTLLWLSSSNFNRLIAKVNRKVEDGDLEGAIKSSKKSLSSAGKVIAATLRNLKKDRDHVEDIISESILHESSRIDRFGTAILVIAAVSPLLGLLGTVTGMISTFDIITEFGTGDPKLLSSGISEALITTKFGLIVAIPMLLVGNVLTSWGQRIKNDLEQAALHIVNTHMQ
jgi:biopolymer transport protein ExbB